MKQSKHRTPSDAEIFLESETRQSEKQFGTKMEAEHILTESQQRIQKQLLKMFFKGKNRTRTYSKLSDLI